MNQEKQDEIEIDLGEILRVLWHRAWMIILIGAVFAAAVYACTKLFITPQYKSVTGMYVLARQNAGFGTLTSSELSASNMLTSDYVEVIKSRTVSEKVIEKLGLDMTYEQLLSKMTVTVKDNTRIINIAVLDQTPSRARDIADAIREASSEQIKAVTNVEMVNVVDMANLPKRPASPNATKNGVIAGVLGCVLAAAVIVIRFILNDTIQTAEDVERYLELSTLGTIPLNKAEGGKKPKKKQAQRRK